MDFSIRLRTQTYCKEGYWMFKHKLNLDNEDRVKYYQYKYSEEEHLEHQNVLLEMLVELDRICIKHQIKYSLFMGTLLGATRHKGFIPWDDDLDIAMLRDEYNKFLSICRSEINNEKFFLQDNISDPNYLWGYARIRRRDSEFVRLGQEHLKMKTGIFIDIFPLDATPSNNVFSSIYNIFCYVLRKILYSEVGKKRCQNFVGRFVYKVINIIDIKVIHKTVCKLTSKASYSEYVRILTFPLPKSWSKGYQRKWFDNLEQMKFEAGEFFVSKYYDEILEYSYGDYHELPPVNERVCQHPASSFKLPSDSISFKQ